MNGYTSDCLHIAFQSPGTPSRRRRRAAGCGSPASTPGSAFILLPPLHVPWGATTNSLPSLPSVRSDFDFNESKSLCVVLRPALPFPLATFFFAVSDLVIFLCLYVCFDFLLSMLSSLRFKLPTPKQVAATVSPSGWLWDARKKSHGPLDAIG